MKVLKTSQQHTLKTTTFQKKYKYLATKSSHLEKHICLYYMLELEITVHVVIEIMIYPINIFVITPFVVGAMKQRMVSATSFIATNTETNATNSLK